MGSIFPLCDLLVSKYGWGVRLFACLSRCQNMVKKYRVGWCSKFAFNFG